MSDFHYFGSTAYGWAVADTRKGVLRKLARAVGRTTLNQQVKVNLGLYAVTMKVHAPISAEYDIDGYQPVGMKVSDKASARIVKMDGSTVAVA